MTDLASQNCQPVSKGDTPLTEDKVAGYLVQLPAWQTINQQLFRKFNFSNFQQTMNFVNAVASIAEACDHHPDLKVSYGYCEVYYSTHAVNGLTINDFICAARINALV